MGSQKWSRPRPGLASKSPTLVYVRESHIRPFVQSLSNDFFGRRTAEADNDSEAESETLTEASTHPKSEPLTAG